MLSCDSLLSIAAGLYLIVSGVQGLREGKISFRSRNLLSRRRYPVEGRLARILAWVFIVMGIVNLGAFVFVLANPENSKSLFTVFILTAFVVGFASFICLLLQAVKPAAKQLHKLRTGNDT